jgi:hypothetical protein
VTARDVASLVRDTQVEMMRKRSAEPKESLIDKLILDEMQKMTSLVDGEKDPGGSGSEGSMSLDPHAFVNTSDWANELGAQPPRRAGRPSQQPGNKPRAGMTPTPGPGEMESLEAMLEPERTGVHGKADRKTPWVLIIVIMLVLAAGAAAAVVLMMT